MITANRDDNGDLAVLVDGKPVLLISECSDAGTINLFFYPQSGSTVISNTDSSPEYPGDYTHELLCIR